MYNTTGIEHWMAASEPICDGAPTETGHGAQASKRSYPISDAESYIPPKRNRGEHSGPETSLCIDTRTADDLSADDEEVSGLDIWTILRTIPKAINLRAFVDSDVDRDAPLGFAELLEQILTFAQGVNTIPAQLKVSCV